ncbi:SDR family oxidoreductase [Corticicoccus populi]|uniref:SDR family oxidoreductase n=1 Tax=Corticicoccus populi TaxID=1812821 RepID=A0ABW5WS51_9STAP
MSNTVLITGVSRPGSIGTEIARHFLNEGFNVIVHGLNQYDQQMLYKDKDSAAEFEGDVVKLADSDLSTEDGIQELAKMIESNGNINHLVLCHAYSTQSHFKDWSFEEINKHLITNITASMLLVQAFKKQFNSEQGCITLFSSGQLLGPMISEIPYAVSKAGVANLPLHLSFLVGEENIRINAVNPGPTDTGYIDENESVYKEIESRFNQKRWGKPSDIANLISFLHSDKGQWITGQVINSEGGFLR